MTADNSWTQIVAPAGARRETFAVFCAALAILALAVLVIRHNQKSDVQQVTLGTGEISARYDLTPAEQGIYADLLLVYQDWQMQEDDAPAMPVAALVADDWPPFSDQRTGKARGAHRWSLRHIAGRDVYLGLSAQPATAGDFLWILPLRRQGTSVADFVVWLRREGEGQRSSAPNSLDPAELLAGHWRRINPANNLKR